ncbi:hypothetical protein SteCoe_12694 [Stentor coeruleus]|uniref:Tubulin--tyrosine ligase-like protein 9 n=1 Tax=Stentor coeruleus TaxID=5963 RepID=A0A1R2CA82_9CILI|nr:hypothetical protein SteCoe_12694 [Stentor coeruleus]
MKKVTKVVKNQSISMNKTGEIFGLDNRNFKNITSKIQERSKITPLKPSKVLQGRRSHMSQRETISGNNIKSSDISPLNKTAISALATASSQCFRSKNDFPRLLNSSSTDLSRRNRKSLDINARSISPSKLVAKSPIRITKLITNESVSIREASRIKEWASKAKPEIERMWRKTINCANGIEPYNVVFANYSVFIGKGNNAPLIRKLFNSRPWWHVIETKENANFIWTQWKDKQVLEELKCSTSKPQIRNDFDLTPLVCSYKAQIATRVYKSVDIDNLGLQLIRGSNSYVSLRSEKVNPETQRMHNKLENNECLSNKSELLSTMKKYYSAIKSEIYDKIPITFNVSGENDPEYKDFIKVFNKYDSYRGKKKSFQNLWIVKPGEFTNRGQGITVCKNLSEIIAILKPAESKSYILQKYIEKPLLINKRKFDIRCYALVTSINGVIQGYFYLDGYLRTTSTEYTTKDIKNPFIHLTNDAIQKFSTEYGRFENGNKLSYREFQRYLDSHYPEKGINFLSNILPKIRSIIKDTLIASFLKIDPKKRLHSMEILGYDFMIDRKFRPWLIEVNTNPCLELASPLLSSLIPAMVENAFKISVDSIFPAPLGQFLDACPMNRFELIFHQETDGKKFFECLGENANAYFALVQDNLTKE